MDERAEILDLVEGYRRLKAQFGLMDFSDQIALAAELARTQPEVGRLEREKYRIVLLDEYQDTSVAQAQLLSALFSGPAPESGLGHAVTAVGDPNQAIYGWRGASVSNILNFADFFPPVPGSPGPDVLPDGQPALRPAHRRRSPTPWPARCTPPSPVSNRWRPRTAPRRVPCTPWCTRPTPRSWSGWPAR